MRARVLRSFPYSADGTRTATLAAGLEFDCRDDIARGLVAVRLIEPVGAFDKMDREPIEAGPAAEITVTAPGGTDVSGMIDPNRPGWRRRRGR